jgi:hypothetical protein
MIALGTGQSYNPSEPTAKQTKLPNVARLNRCVVQAERNRRIIRWREGDCCQAKVEIDPPSDHAVEHG